MPISKREYQVVLQQHRDLLERLSEGRSVDRLKSLYDRAQAEVISKLKKLPVPMKRTFSAQAMRLTLMQLKQGQVVLAAKMANELGAASRDVQVDSLRTVTRSVANMEQRFAGARPVLPVEEAARFAGVIDKRRTSLMKMHRSSMATYGARLITSMQDELAVSLAAGETMAQAVDRIQEVAGNEWWQAERIVRTESAWAFNATHADGIEEISKDVPGLLMRWTEHVSDDGTPLDDRVGVDSIAMHGQVIQAGGLFRMPPDPRVSPSMWGKTWAFPPNRPNDRSVVIPWKKEWGGFAYKLVGDRRVPISR